MIPHETSLIKLLLKHAEWEESTKLGLSIQDFPKELQPLYSALDSFHAQHEEDLSLGDLANLLFAGKPVKQDYYKPLLDSLESLDVSATTTKTLLNSIVRNRKLKDIALTAYDVTEGRATPEFFQELVDGYNALAEPLQEAEDEDEFITDDLEELVYVAVSKPGLRWRLNTLNRMMGSLRKGNFGFVFARPETGKTTFLASEVTYMASQLSEEDGPIIWIANEEPGINVKLRVYQAWFGIDLVTLKSDQAGWRKKFKEQSKGKLLLPSNQNLSKKEIENLCKKYKPSLLILDQLSKISGFEADRYDLELGAATTWGRDLAKVYCPVVAIHQADGNAEGVKWLNMGHVANAKTAMQADADFILGIGKQNADGYENIRYLHLSKNKLLGDEDTDPNLRHGKLEVLLEAQLARYKDLF